eukprot:PhF_6_TR34678/c0_g1_i2/m.50463
MQFPLRTPPVPENISSSYPVAQPYQQPSMPLPTMNTRLPLTHFPNSEHSRSDSSVQSQSQQRQLYPTQSYEHISQHHNPNTQTYDSYGGGGVVEMNGVSHLLCGECEAAKATTRCLQCHEVYCHSCCMTVHSRAGSRRSLHTEFITMGASSFVQVPVRWDVSGRETQDIERVIDNVLSRSKEQLMHYKVQRLKENEEQLSKLHYYSVKNTSL